MKMWKIGVMACLIAVGLATVFADDANVAVKADDANAVIVTLGDKQIRQQELDVVVGEYLAGQILTPLLDDYARRHNITASDEDVATFFQSTHIGDEPERKLDQAAKRRLAEPFIVNWKVGKALYEQYGGAVMFQQGNPMEPIGAYSAFLHEQERSGAFTIREPYRTVFWKYFDRDPGPWRVKDEEVDFSKPWWLRIIKSEQP